MNYTEEKSKAGEYLRLTLNHLVRYDLPPTPVNYTVWYEYVSGKNIRLRSAVNQYIKKKIPITSENVEILYKKFVTDGDRIVISRLLTRINIMLQDITRHVVEAEGDLVNHGENINGLTEMIHNVKDYEDIKKVVDRMISETDALKASGSRLENRMQVSSKELSQLHRELEKSQQEAHTDALTGLINRRGLEKVLEVERIRSRQNKTPLSAIMLDIDHFKRINDTYGHLVGDSLLKGLGLLLKTKIRKNDMAVRYGGEEFLIVLPETGLEGATAVAEKIKAALNSKEWRIRNTGKNMGRITASMGVSFHEDDDTEEGFIQRADQALYMAKTLGRNRVISQTDLSN